LAQREGEAFHGTFHGPPLQLQPASWGALAQVVRDDRPLPLPEQGEELRRYHAHLLQSASAPARELWESLLPEGALLDLGGGAGAYSVAYRGEATLADTPEVLALADVPNKLPLDLTRDPLPGGFGTVLLCNVLHLFGHEQAARIVQKAAGALRPGGTL